MQLDALQDAACLYWRHGLVERSWRVGRQVVQHEPDALSLRVVDVHQITHALGKVMGRSPLSDFHLAPTAMGIKEDEQIGGAVALVLAVIAQGLARLGR